MVDRYAVLRWSSPGESSIEIVPDGYMNQPGSPGEVFDTFTQAKAWLEDQTRAWVSGFRDDAAEIRDLRKSDVRRVSDVELATGYAKHTPLA